MKSLTKCASSFLWQWRTSRSVYLGYCEVEEPDYVCTVFVTVRMKTGCSGAIGEGAGIIWSLVMRSCWKRLSIAFLLQCFSAVQNLFMQKQLHSLFILWWLLGPACKIAVLAKEVGPWYRISLRTSQLLSLLRYFLSLLYPEVQDRGYKSMSFGLVSYQ
jgi:hypothetical protein